MARARLAAELPTAESWLARGNLKMARECVTKSKRLPALRESDSFVMNLYRQCVSRMGQGAQVELVRWRCQAAGLSEAAALEVFERACLVDAVISDYRRRLMEAHRGT